MRIRLWVLGLAFLGFGACAHFAIMFDPLPGRIEEGGFAIFEMMVYAVGLGLIFMSLLHATIVGKARVDAWVTWLIAVILSMLSVLFQLPT
ncbi:hypothetical protein [Singulisphaera sp. PoT]|uniref:hypothetical protein n=1 Tax=Singulisphaera sp. PoT TaxID=3411797 RepID=UPI003BF5D400